MGRVVNGTLRADEQLALCRADGSIIKRRPSALLAFEGLDRSEVAENSLKLFMQKVAPEFQKKTVA